LDKQEHVVNTTDVKATGKDPKAIPDSAKYFDDLPDSAFVRLPTVKVLKSASSATIWRWVKAGRLPAPHKLSPGVTAWNVGELRRADNEA
jgi:predicted DNA-binding transcriptional regulator AlpA